VIHIEISTFVFLKEQSQLVLNGEYSQLQETLYSHYARQRRKLAECQALSGSL